MYIYVLGCSLGCGSVFVYKRKWYHVSTTQFSTIGLQASNCSLEKTLEEAKEQKPYPCIYIYIHFGIGNTRRFSNLFLPRAIIPHTRKITHSAAYSINLYSCTGLISQEQIIIYQIPKVAATVFILHKTKKFPYRTHRNLLNYRYMRLDIAQ